MAEDHCLMMTSLKLIKFQNQQSNYDNENESV